MDEYKNRKASPKRANTVRSDTQRRLRQHVRLARVLQILGLIQSRGRWNAKAIASELECSERTVYRDMEVLEYAGIPWFFDEHDQCYRLRPEYRFAVPSLTPDEVLGQVVAAKLSDRVELGLNPGVRSTTQKLTHDLSLPLQQTLNDAQKLVEVLGMKLVDHSKHQQELKTIQQALLAGRQLSATYQSPYDSQPVKFRLHPYRLCLIKNAWYLIGRMESEDTPRTFRVARFKSLRLLNHACIRDENFQLDDYFGHAWSVFRGNERHAVRLRFLPPASRIVLETQWHHTQKSHSERDGSLVMTFEVDGLEEILNWILGWAGKVQVLAPDELKVRHWERLEEALDLNSRG
jgi:predicted DNA-binding transcriptional regulator YafY